MTRIPAGAVWVRLPRFIGDSIMISRALEPLRAASLPLVAWGPAQVAGLFEGSNAFTAVRADAPGERSAFSLARALRAHRPAGVLAMGRSTRPLLAAALARVPLRLGWREGGGWILSTCSRRWMEPARHHMDRYAALIADGFPALPAAEGALFEPGAEAKRIAEALAASLGLKKGFVACALGAASWNKRIGQAVWDGVLAGLEAEKTQAVLLGHGPEEQQMAEALLAARPSAISLVGRADLATVAALLRQAGALIGGDSAMAHLAAAAGCPVVAAFGPTRPEWSAPRGGAVRIIRQTDLPCLGCMEHGCPVEGHPCMEALAPGRLLEAVAEIRLH